MLKANFKKALPGFNLEVDFSVNQEILAILGPSGSGKTMTLKCIAGLLQPDEGHIELNGKVLFDSASHINLPPQQRKVGFVFQNYALFPHLNVEKNIAYGINHYAKDDIEKRVSWLLDKMGISGLRNRYPRELSSGQQQRVALARAISNSPDAILMDEPFSALDSMRRQRLELELIAMQDFYQGDMLFVTHDLAQGYKLGSRIGVYEMGQMVQCDCKEHVILCPQNRTVARLTGVKNLIHASIIDIKDSDVWANVPDLGESLRIKTTNANGFSVGQKVTLGIRPEYIHPTLETGENAVSCTLQRIVEEVTDISYYFKIHTKTDEEHHFEVTLSKLEINGISCGDACYLYLPPERLAIIPE